MLDHTWLYTENPGEPKPPLFISFLYFNAADNPNLLGNINITAGFNSTPLPSEEGVASIREAREILFALQTSLFSEQDRRERAGEPALLTDITTFVYDQQNHDLTMRIEGARIPDILQLLRTDERLTQQDTQIIFTDPCYATLFTDVPSLKPLKTDLLSLPGTNHHAQHQG